MLEHKVMVQNCDILSHTSYNNHIHVLWSKMSYLVGSVLTTTISVIGIIKTQYYVWIYIVLTIALRRSLV